MAITEEDRTRMGTPHPQLLEATEKNPFPDLSGGDPNASRGGNIRQNRAAHLARLRHLYPIPGPIPEQVTETEHQVPVRDGSNIRVRVYVPTRKPSQGSPLVLMFHEGGWSMGDLTDEDQNCRLFARDLGAVSVNVEYRLAPEHPFPTSVTDAYDVVKWCATNAYRSSSVLPADPKKGFIVGGASAGGNLSAVVCQLGRDEGLEPPLTGQYLCVPALLWNDVVPEKWKAEYRSRFEATKDPVLKMDPKGTDSLMESLKPDVASSLFSPLLHMNLKNLPPAFFQLGGLDPLRDEALIYERVLREENRVPTKLNVYDGFGHMFWTNWPTMPRSKEFVDDTLAGVKWLLEVGEK
ncbi:hypothetical protein LTR37_008028 [Vermiconidia calcicola]|uniref:Uncharacterized protein n=1 Tax=Vermiconidia calcicola TaxID=1690605 RepID=A0ACC3NC53_9PEZI|nr:hypothetical protein LTR37_008028 [Vermiconidia calcicola]